MAEYIEREAVVDTIYAAFKKYWAIPCSSVDLAVQRDVVHTKNKIYNIPAADVAPVVHGEWVQVICHVEFEDGFVDRLYECCSRCRKPNGRKTSDYCPHCGARMDGE